MSLITGEEDRRRKSADEFVGIHKITCMSGACYVLVNGCLLKLCSRSKTGQS